MDLRAYYIQAAEAAAAAIHAEDDDDVVELTHNAVVLKFEVHAARTADVPALHGSSALSPLGAGNAEAGIKIVVEGNGGRRDLTCPECSKTFLSDKAMYGHLRSHPERGYKGANRPAVASPTACAGDKRPRKALQKEVELPAMNMCAAEAVAAEKTMQREGELLWNWSLTAKRGRSSSTPSAGSAPLAEVHQSSRWYSEEEEEAAMILLDMAFLGATSSSETQQSQLPVHARYAKNQIPDVEQPMPLDPCAQNKMSELMQQMPLDHVPCTVMAHQKPETGHQIATAFAVESQLTPEVKELTKQVDVPTKAVVDVVGDKKRKKRRVQDSEQTPGTASPADAASVMPPAPRRFPSPASDKKHECQKCSKSFSTHQALGGHMAGHNKHGAFHDDPARVQAMQNAMQNILAADRRLISYAIIDATVVAKAAVSGGGQGGSVPAEEQRTAVAGGDQEGTVAGAGQERRDDQPAAPMSSAPHVCPECNIAFRSGQALGGHKRKHWFAEKRAKAALAAAPRNFDLNELPRDGGRDNNP